MVKDDEGKNMTEEIYEVRSPRTIKKDENIQVAVPGSKSITNRALLLAAMAQGESTLQGCLTSEDAYHFLQCLKELGFSVRQVSDGALGSNITIVGLGGRIPKKYARIYVGSAGTAARFLVAMLAFSDGEYLVDASEQMRKRPMQPLIEALRGAGAVVVCTEREGYFPLRICGASDKARIPDRISVNIDKSSQFLSALLIAAGTLHKKIEIVAEGSHGLSYVNLTMQMMKDFGVSAEVEHRDGRMHYLFAGKDGYQPQQYMVEPDMSAAAYFYAAAALLGVRLSVRGVTSHMQQGDTAFLQVLEQMGCSLEERDALWLTGAANGKLSGGFSIDMSAFSDQALTLAAIAPFADAPITITGIGHIRLQECDRMQAIVHNLHTLHIVTEEKEDTLTIYPGCPKGGLMETYEDHRVAMAFALVGLRCEHVRIQNPSCCKKTFAEYFEVFESTFF